MKIFEHYLGSAMLNNALQTIEAIAGLNHVSEISTEILVKIFKENDLPHLYLRLKNYTMLFSKNGPLYNDKNNGLRIYKTLMTTLFETFENEGEYQCEISGLFFKKTFAQLYSDVLGKLGIPSKGKDISINRVWWPLIGGLGSDAQALPQAKFPVTIHPICLAIIQFLPLSALLYKGKILLVDSINFEFSREFIRKNFQQLNEKIELTPKNSVIDNIKLMKGDYIIRALNIFDEMRFDFEDATDLNLWSFTNSGTGAACKIERIPSQLFQKLFSFYLMASLTEELKGLLRSRGSNVFLVNLEANEDCYLLYPTKKYEGVSVEFFERYHQLIQNDTKLALAGYISGLIEKYLLEKQRSFFSKTDSYKSLDYSKELYAILLKAAENGEWNLALHCQILDNPNEIPVKNSTYGIQKMVHFYYLRKHFKEKPILNEAAPSTVLSLCAYFVNVIENDPNSSKILRDLTDRQNYHKTNIESAIVRMAETVELNAYYQAIYSEGVRKPYGLFDLLRLHYVSKDLEILSEAELPEPKDYPFLKKYELFAINYIDYYFDKYKATDDKLPLNKFKHHVLNQFPKNNSQFYFWLNEAVENISQHSEYDVTISDLLVDELGKPNITFARFAINFYLTKFQKK